jgi:hypothetical protein
MSTEQPPQTPAPQQAPTVVRSPLWRVIYGNSVNIQFGDNDVRIGIGLDQNPNMPGQSTLEEAAIILTPRTAKLLAHALGTIIANFEAANGPISIPQAKIENVAEQIAKQATRPKPAT